MADVAMPSDALPVGSKGRHASGWWGVIAVIATEAALFAYLIFSYYFIASHAAVFWPPKGKPLSLDISIPITIVLILGSVSMWWAERALERGNLRGLSGGLLATLALAAIFLGLEGGVEWPKQSFKLTDGVYGSLYYTITGFHMAHVSVGFVIIAVLLVWSRLGYFGKPRHDAVSIGALYWHFVTVVWLFVFGTLYVSPYLA